jgi:hypothetical protein
MLLAKVLMILVIVTLFRFALFWMFTRLGVVLLGAAGWFEWSK